jgi:hypothetical protein
MSTDNLYSYAAGGVAGGLPRWGGRAQRSAPVGGGTPLFPLLKEHIWLLLN